MSVPAAARGAAAVLHGHTSQDWDGVEGGQPVFSSLLLRQPGITAIRHGDVRNNKIFIFENS